MGSGVVEKFNDKQEKNERQCLSVLLALTVK